MNLIKATYNTKWGGSMRENHLLFLLEKNNLKVACFQIETMPTDADNYYFEIFSISSATISLCPYL